MGEQRDEGTAEVRRLSQGPELAAFGQIVGWAFGTTAEESSTLALAAAVFAGPAPAMPDMF